MSEAQRNHLTIRAFLPTDFPTIAAAAAQTAWDHLTPAEQACTNPGDVGRRAAEQAWRLLSAQGSACFVAEAGGVILAYEQLLIRTDEISGVPEALKVDGWVHPAYRGQGLNRLMHQAGEDWCISHGVRRMVAVVAAHNPSSLKATDRAGFVTERAIRSKWLG